MSLLPLPMLVLNLGVEMVYILAQRLEAQKISDDKASKVVNDVLRYLSCYPFEDERTPSS